MARGAHRNAPERFGALWGFATHSLGVLESLSIQNSGGPELSGIPERSRIQGRSRALWRAPERSGMLRNVPERSRDLRIHMRHMDVCISVTELSLYMIIYHAMELDVIIHEYS